MRRIKTLILPVCALLIFSHCKRLSEGEFMGTEYKVATSGFSVTDEVCAKKMNELASPTCLDGSTTVSFGVTSVTFQQQFSESVSWTVKITGQASGAYKIISGTSSFINETNCVWDGSPSMEAYRFFKPNEVCDVKVTYLGSSMQSHTQIKIINHTTGVKNYDGINFQGVYFVRIDDFDVPSDAIRTSYVDLNDGEGNNIYLTREVDNVIPVQRDFMLRLTGNDHNNNTYLGGTSGETLMSHAGLLSVNDPDQLYFNAYVYGTGYTNTCIQIRAYEWDNFEASQIGSFNYNSEEQTKNDQWVYDLYVDWRGWKLISIKYSSFKPSSNPLAGGNGNRIREPYKITSWGLLLQSLPTSGAHVDAYMDQIYATEGGPFRP